MYCIYIVGHGLLLSGFLWLWLIIFFQTFLWCILSWGQRVHHHLSHVTPFVMRFGPHLLRNRFSGTSIVMCFAGHLLHNRFNSTLHSLPISRCFACIHVAAVVTLDVRPQGYYTCNIDWPVLNCMHQVVLLWDIAVNCLCHPKITWSKIMTLV